MANGYELTIDTSASLEDAKQIESIVTQIKSDMETLNAGITSNIPEPVRTDWAETLLENWQQYYTADVPEAMDSMIASARNLELAVENAIKYSTES